ncbi:MAG: PD40 domain-containing protein [Planctomycetia bacterium]|nr:PD40 domain-containing protein [Planctomycetia bacterium]
MRPIAAVVALLVLALPGAAQQELRPRWNRDWKTVKTENFQVHYSDDDIRERALEVGAWLEDAYLKIGPALDAKLRRPAHCFVYRSLNDFQTTTVFEDGIPEGVLGVTEWYQDRIVVPCVGSDKLMQRVVQHEFTHQLMFNEYYKWKIPSYPLAKEALLPEWFVEGLAEFESRDIDSWDRMLLCDAALDGRVRSLRSLHGFGHLDPHEIREAYITGFLALRHLEKAYGEGSVRKLFREFAGFPWPASAQLKPITKKGYAEFDREFRDALKAEFTELTAGTTEADRHATAVTKRDSHYRRWNLSPRFSPDGSRIAYLSDRSGVFSVHVVNADGSGRTSPLLFQAGQVLEYADPSPSGVAWTPDGTRIAFVGERGQRKDIWVCAPRPMTPVRKLGFRFEEMSSPAISPDGTRVVFSAMQGGRTDLWIGNMDGGGLARLTKDRWHDDYPCWSPDGKTVVYASEHEGQADLYVVDVATGESVALAKTAANEITPQFSPDGKYLAYASDEGGIWNIWVMEMENGRGQRVTNVPVGAGSPTWAPGGILAFSVYRHGEFHIWKMKLDLEDEGWAPVPSGEPREDYADLFVRPVEDFTIQPLSDRWHLDLLMPLGLVNFGYASTLTGRQAVAADANLTTTLNGLRVNADLAYLNLMLPVGFLVDLFDHYSVFEERDLVRQEHQFGFFAGTIVPLDPYRRVTLGYTLYENRIKYDSDVVEDETPRNGGLVVAVTHNSVRGRGLNPIGGWQLTLGAEWFARGLGSQERRTNYFWSNRQFIEVWEDVVVAFGSAGTLSFGRDTDATDLGDVIRGYRYGRRWGARAASGFLEVRFPIARGINWVFPGELFLLKDIRGYCFADVGFVTDDRPADLFRHANHPDWRHSVGGGFYAEFWILESLPVPIGLEFAQPTDSRQPFSVRLTVGFSF